MTTNVVPFQTPPRRLAFTLNEISAKLAESLPAGARYSLAGQDGRLEINVDLVGFARALRYYRTQRHLVVRALNAIRPVGVEVQIVFRYAPAWSKHPLRLAVERLPPLRRTPDPRRDLIAGMLEDLESREGQS